MALLVISLLSIIFFNQKIRSRKLSYEQDQNKAAAEIYKVLLDQETRIDDAKRRVMARISQELHDGILSKMFAIRFTLNNLNSRFDQNSLEDKQKHLNHLRLVEEEIRLISHDLQRNPLDEIDFLHLLKTLTQERNGSLGFTPSLSSKSKIEWKKINNSIKINLYRIIQEALQNIAKHAEASEAAIVFEMKENNLVMKIIDNGKGFNVDKVHKGIGLKNIKTRVKDASGSFQLHSGELGTIIIIKLSVNYG